MDRIMIAGTASGVGKTTISLGIMAALTKRGKRVAPFKVGPDYIDPRFHQFVTGNPSNNLDSWLLREAILKTLFTRNMVNKDIGIIEGVMGLYDGFGIEKDQGSSAHLSKILKTPIVLVIDGKGLSSSAAAIVLGYKLYDPEVPIKGIIINRVSGEKHYELLKMAIEKHVNIPCIGYLPSNLNITLNSRHLGLVPANEVKDLEVKVNALTDVIESTINLDKLLEISQGVAPIKLRNKEILNLGDLEYIAKGLKIGIAQDKAFNFYYEDNIQLLKEIGVKLIPLSPVEDKHIPEGLDGLYLGGGFPEVFTKELEGNIGFRKELKDQLEAGLPVYGECGGLMYLTQSIEDLEGQTFEMVGYLPTRSKMTKKLQRFGYVEIHFGKHVITRGHEFHRSMIEDRPGIEYGYRVYKKRGGQIQKSWSCGVRKQNVLAGYPHVHFYSNLDFLKRLLMKCREVSFSNTYL